MIRKPEEENNNFKLMSEDRTNNKLFKFIKTQLRRKIIQDSIINFFSQVIIIFFTISFISLLSRVLEKKEMGFFVIMQVIQGLVGTIGYLGLPTAAIRNIPALQTKNYYQTINLIIKISIILPMLLCTFFLIVIFILREPFFVIFTKGHILDDFYIIIILINVLVMIFSDLVSLLLQALQNFFYFALLQVSLVVSQRLLGGLLVLKYGLKGVFIGFLVGGILCLIIGIIMLRPYLFKGRRIIFLKSFISFSIPYWIHGILRYSYTQLDQLLVGLFFTPEKLAGYYLIKKITSLINIFFSKITEVIIPKLIEKNSIGNYHQHKKKINLIYHSISLLIVLLLILFSKKIIFLLGGCEYKNEYVLLILSSISLYVYNIFSLYNIDVYVLKKPKELLIFNFIISMSSLSVSLFLLIIFGGIEKIIVGQIIGLLSGMFLFNQLSASKSIKEKT